MKRTNCGSHWDAVARFIGGSWDVPDDHFPELSSVCICSPRGWWGMWLCFGLGGRKRVNRLWGWALVSRIRLKQTRKWPSWKHLRLPRISITNIAILSFHVPIVSILILRRDSLLNNSLSKSDVYVQYGIKLQTGTKIPKFETHKTFKSMSSANLKQRFCTWGAKIIITIKVHLLRYALVRKIERPFLNARRNTPLIRIYYSNFISH